MKSLFQYEPMRCRRGPWRLQTSCVICGREMVIRAAQRAGRLPHWRRGRRRRVCDMHGPGKRACRFTEVSVATAATSQQASRCTDHAPPRLSRATWQATRPDTVAASRLEQPGWPASQWLSGQTTSPPDARRDAVSHVPDDVRQWVADGQMFLWPSPEREALCAEPRVVRQQRQARERARHYRRRHGAFGYAGVEEETPRVTQDVRPLAQLGTGDETQREALAEALAAALYAEMRSTWKQEQQLTAAESEAADDQT